MSVTLLTSSSAFWSSSTDRFFSHPTSTHLQPPCGLSLPLFASGHSASYRNSSKSKLASIVHPTATHPSRGFRLKQASPGWPSSVPAQPCFSCAKPYRLRCSKPQRLVPGTRDTKPQAALRSRTPALPQGWPRRQVARVASRSKRQVAPSRESL